MSSTVILAAAAAFALGCVFCLGLWWLSTHRSKRGRTETMKATVWLCLCNGCAWVWCSYLLAYLGRATMPIVILHFLSFKLVTWLGLLATGGEPYLLAAFPIYFTGGAWWLAYTAAGLVLPLAANAVYKKIKNTVLAH